MIQRRPGTPFARANRRCIAEFDLGPEVLSQKLWYDQLFSESTESASMHSDGGIGVRSPEEEWSCNVIYLQASVNVCSQEKYEIEIKAGDQSSVSPPGAFLH